MALVVQKFGGTSVADADRMKAVADHIARTRRTGDEVIVVVSAMGKATDDLLRLAEQVSTVRPGREMDMLWTAGERISMALLCMALAERGVPAASFTGSQAGIITDTIHTKARIIEVKGDRIREALAAGAVPVVAGFQGVSSARDITTLGRGGSDTTAVALAAALAADRCEIYTDVSGVFSRRPPDSARPPASSPGSRSRRCSRSPPRAAGCSPSAQSSSPGTTTSSCTSAPASPGSPAPSSPRRTPPWSSPSSRPSRATPRRRRSPSPGVLDRPGIAAALFRSLADRFVNVDMIVQNISHAGTTDISFTVPKADLAPSLEVAQELLGPLGAASVFADEDVAQVSLVGAGMKTHPGVTATMFETLAREGINIEMISTSPIRISCMVRIDAAERAVQALHAAFELGS